MCKDWIEWTAFSCEDRYMCQPKDNGGPFWPHIFHINYNDVPWVVLQKNIYYILLVVYSSTNQVHQSLN